MRPEALVNACTTTLEQQGLAWALAVEMGPMALLNTLQACSLEACSPAELRALAARMRELAESIENYAGHPDAEAAMRTETRR